MNMSDSINPNADLTSTQPVDTKENGPVSVGNGGDISFDTLESAGVAAQPFSKKLYTKPEKEVKAEEEVKGEKEPKAEAKGEKEEDKAELSAEAKEEAEKAAKAPKTMKLKTTAGREVEIDPGQKIIVPVDGIDEEFTLQELKNLKSGERSYDKKFTELDKRDKEYLADKAATEEQFTKIMKHAYQGDIDDAILAMVDMCELDPAPILKKLADKLIGNLDQFQQMTPEQRELHFIKKENDFLRKAQQSKQMNTKQEEASKALDAELTSMRETLGVTDEEIEMAEELVRQNPKAYEGQKFDKKEAIKLADELKRWELAKNALTKVNPDLAMDEDLIGVCFRKLANNRGVTVDQAADYIAKTLKMTPKEDTATAKAMEAVKNKVEANKNLLGQGSKTMKREAEDAALIPVANDDDYDPRKWKDL